MKKQREIISRTRELAKDPGQDLTPLLWELICYPPKIAPDLLQRQLLAEAGTVGLEVYDEYFSGRDLTFRAFSWETGSRKILVTHGWGSKATDFAALISELRKLDNVQVIALDAPGNGSSEGELSNLLLFVLAVKSIIRNFGAPDILIGHSLGAMANILSVSETGISPSLLVSIAPLIRHVIHKSIIPQNCVRVTATPLRRHNARYLAEPSPRNSPIIDRSAYPLAPPEPICCGQLLWLPPIGG